MEMQAIIHDLIDASLRDVKAIKEVNLIIRKAIEKEGGSVENATEVQSIRDHLVQTGVIKATGNGGSFEVSAKMIRKYCGAHNIELPKNFGLIPRIVGMDRAEMTRMLHEQARRHSSLPPASQAPGPTESHYLRGKPATSAVAPLSSAEVVVVAEPAPAPAPKRKMMRALTLEQLGLTAKEVERDPILAGLIAATATDSPYRRQKVRRVLIEYMARPYRKSRVRDLLREVRDLNEAARAFFFRSMVAMWLGDPDPE